MSSYTLAAARGRLVAGLLALAVADEDAFNDVAFRYSANPFDSSARAISWRVAFRMLPADERITSTASGLSLYYAVLVGTDSRTVAK